uniref:Cystatin fetuin-A-type domain-containing protein n=1 Tax=Naja naja TaxID=35670 RepID=A0A8C6XRB1_NAJNA
MNSLVTLVLLGQIIGCTFSHHLLPQLDCNGEEAENLAELAEQYINEHNLHGYKHTLNVIKDVHVLPRRPHGKVIFLNLEFLETVCHVSDPTPIENCTVRPDYYHAVEAECDVRLLSDEDVVKVVASKCHSEADSVENVRQKCPKCPILIPLNDPHVVQSVEYVLRKYNEEHPEHVFEVLEISRGQHKYDPEAFYVEFAIVETNCSAQEAHDDHHDCHPKAAGEARAGFCRATVFRSHADLEKPKDELYESDCVIFDVKVGHSHTHLIEHHFGKNIPSPGHNNTILDLVHSHNHTSASHESNSHEHVAATEVVAPVAKREAPTAVSHDHTHATKLCPGRVHHFKV